MGFNWKQFLVRLGVVGVQSRVQFFAVETLELGDPDTYFVVHILTDVNILIA